MHPVGSLEANVAVLSRMGWLARVFYDYKLTVPQADHPSKTCTLSVQELKAPTAGPVLTASESRGRL